MKNKLFGYNLELIVFVTGACGMILELAGSRVLAPYAGSSLSTWTSLIGIVLGCLSLGYWLGGKLADKSQSYKVLAFIILVAGILIGLSGLIKDDILNFLARDLHLDIKLLSIISSLVLFGLPSIALGLVSPYAVRLKIEQISTSGKIVGNLYAISTFGSIFGTFIGGFYLIPYLGNSNLLFLLSFVLLLTALLIAFRQMWPSLFIFILIISFNALRDQTEKSNLIVDIDSQFQRIQIYPAVDKATSRPVYALKTDAGGIQSAVFTDGSTDLVFDYARAYKMSEIVNPDLGSALMIGGAAYSYPRDFLNSFNGSTMDVVEIDPTMTTIAKKYLFLKDDARLNIFHEDGRVFLNNCNTKYDVVYLDAFKSLSPPIQLTTKEAIQGISANMTEKGFLMANVISSFEGSRNRFLWAEYSTFKQVFPYVEIFRVYNVDLKEAQNIMLVGFKNRDQWERALNNPKYSEQIYRGEIQNMPFLTDELAPVDAYMNISL